MKLLAYLFSVIFLSGGPAWARLKITGAGATFPRPIYATWISEYQKMREGNVVINYQAIGSGGGIRQLTKQTVDFAASDAPMTPQDKKSIPWKVKHIPTVLGAIVLAYNVPEISSLKLDGPTLANIFLSNITKWNDPQIAALNKGVSLPNTDILVVRRADGSGSTWVFSDYLNKVSQPWEERMGRGKTLRWPGTTIGAKGNDGVTGVVKKTPGSVGYIELSYALENNIPIAAIKNSAGKFVIPSTQTISAASGSVGNNPNLAQRSITNSTGPNAYPISAFTYILLPESHEKNKEKITEVKRFLRWALTEGQKMAPELHYAPLSAPLAKALLKSITP